MSGRMYYRNLGTGTLMFREPPENPNCWGWYVCGPDDFPGAKEAGIQLTPAEERCLDGYCDTPCYVVPLQ